MQKKIFILIGSALLMTAAVQFAAASERHLGRKAHHAPAAPIGQQIRNSNAAWPAPSVQPDWSRYSGGFSAPAGR
jgi:hypothetical protein